VQHREVKSLLLEMLEDSVKLSKEKFEGIMPYMECAPPRVSKEHSSPFEEESYEYSSYHTGTSYYFEREARREIHKSSNLELFGLIMFIDGTVVTTFRGKKVIPIFLSTTLQRVEHRKIYLFGYLPVLPEGVISTSDLWFYWRNQVLNALMTKFDKYNQVAGLIAFPGGPPLVITFAFLITDYPEGCDQCHFKNSSAGLRPCRLCLVPRKHLRNTKHKPWPYRDRSRIMQLWSEVYSETYVSPDSLIPTTVEEWIKKFPDFAATASRLNVDEVDVSEMMSRLDSEIVERQRRLLNLKDVNRLKKSASCLGIPNWKKLKKKS
jgi:hypothetical protein